MNYKDVGVRALKTFVQAFLGVLAVQVMAVKSWDTLWPVVAAGAAAGISAVWNLLNELYQTRK